MQLPTQILTERPRLALAFAAVLFVATFVLRLVAPAAGDGVTFLYVLPVVIVAVAYGARAGLAAGGVAFALATVWVVTEHVPVSALGYVVRASVFGFVGILVGRFATNLRKARQGKKISQEELGFRCELHRTEISLLERGGREPRLGTIVKLCGALETTPDELCAGIRWNAKSQKFAFKK